MRCVTRWGSLDLPLWKTGDVTQKLLSHPYASCWSWDSKVLPLGSQFQTSYGVRERNPDWKESVEITPSPLTSARGGPQHSARRARHSGFQPRAWGAPGSFPGSPESWIRLPSLNLYCRAFCMAKSPGGLQLPVGSQLPGSRGEKMHERGGLKVLFASVPRICPQTFPGER